MDDLMAFVTARLGEDERELQKDPPVGLGYANLPARVRREIMAYRALAELHRVNEEPQRWGDSHSDPAMRGQPTGRTSYWCDECDHDRDYGHIGGPEEGCGTLRHLAAIWSDHWDYRPEWKP